MNKIELEKEIADIYTLRGKKSAIARQIKEKVDKVFAQMKSVGKKTLKTSNYSVEIMTRIRRDMDFDQLDKLQEKGLIPKEVMQKSEYERLVISTHQNMELVDGKWVTK